MQRRILNGLCARRASSTRLSGRGFQGDGAAKSVDLICGVALYVDLVEGPLLLKVATGLSQRQERSSCINSDSQGTAGAVLIVLAPPNVPTAVPNVLVA